MMAPLILSGMRVPRFSECAQREILLYRRPGLNMDLSRLTDRFIMMRVHVDAAHLIPPLEQDLSKSWPSPAHVQPPQDDGDK